MGKGDAKGFTVEACIRVRYDIVAYGQDDAIERAKARFGEDLVELADGAYDPDNYAVLATVTGDAVAPFAAAANLTEEYEEIEEG